MKKEVLDNNIFQEEKNAKNKLASLKSLGPNFLEQQ